MSWALILNLQDIGSPLDDEYFSNQINSELTIQNFKATAAPCL